MRKKPRARRARPQLRATSTYLETIIGKGVCWCCKGEFFKIVIRQDEEGEGYSEIHCSGCSKEWPGKIRQG